MVKEKVDKENTMFARLRNPAQFPAQLTFFPRTIIIFFPHPVRRPAISTIHLSRVAGVQDLIPTKLIIFTKTSQSSLLVRFYSTCVVSTN